MGTLFEICLCQKVEGIELYLILILKLLQTGGWNLCTIADAILSRGLSDTTEINRLLDGDKLNILQKIGSTQTNCFNVGTARTKNKAILVINKEIIDYVLKNCKCLAFKVHQVA